MKRLNYLCLVGLLFVSAASAAPPVYNIVPLGLDDPEHTGSNGYKYSIAYQLNEAGQVRVDSQRFNGGSADLGWSVGLYNGVTTINIGLTGAEHTRTDGYKLSNAGQPNEAGQVSGVSVRYNGSAGRGQSAWLYNGTSTIDIGLTGPEHTRNDGSKSSYDPRLNEAGQVTGNSLRYNGGSTDLGRSAWLYDGATTIDIGLTDSEHTFNNGHKYSEAQQLNEAGQVSGFSYRYNGGSTFLGSSAWLYNGATTIDIGPTGSEHTRNDGYKYSYAEELNEAGQVRGYSYRYDGGGTDLGRSAWLYNGATTIDIGFTGAEYTRNDGYKYSSAEQLNEAGQVSGYSIRYNGGGTDLGRSAWLYNGATTIELGLTGSEHTRNDGYKYSSGLLNEAGQVSGVSYRYNGGGTDLGRSAWLYNGATTIDIGLTDSEHTFNNGHKYSEAQQLNEAGQVSGFSYRYNGGSTFLGQSQSAWLYDGETTIDIGLTGSEHTRNNGLKYSVAQQMSEAGQVCGYSYRYNGGSTQLGQDAWLYDPVLDQTFALQLSERSDGYAFSSAAYLGEDGLVLGTYTLFNALDTNLGSRAFYFTIADGLHDLGSLVDGGLAANDWDYLASAVRANGLGQILGHGKLTSQSSGQMAYLLTPIVVPEPSTFLLAAAAFGLCITERRRRAQNRAVAPLLAFSVCIAVLFGLQSQSARADSAVAWGSNGYGQLGDGTTTNHNTPMPVSGMDSGVTAIAAGANHSLAVQNGAVYAWGYNLRGELGDGTTTNRLTPVPVIGLASGVTAIAASGIPIGTGYSLAIQNGGLFAWGRNGEGQLGDGTFIRRLTPVAVSGMDSGVTAIGAGYTHSLAVKDGGLYAWGANGNGQLGNGTLPTCDPCVNFVFPTPAAVIGLASGVTAISAGRSHSLAVKNGRVYSWGSNVYGELGPGSSGGLSNPTPELVAGLESGATAVAAGSEFSLAVVNGSAYYWGRYFPTPVQVDPTNLSNIVAVAASNCCASYALSSDGRLWSGLSGPTPQELLPPTGYKFTSIDADPSGGHVVATLAGVPEPSTFLLAAAALGLCITRRRRRARNDNQNAARTNACIPQRGVALVLLICTAALFGLQSQSAHADSAVAWGENYYGELGDGTITWHDTPMPVSGMDSGVTAVAAGYFYSLGVQNGGAYAWGENIYGQLGDGTTTNRSTPVPVSGLASGVTAVAATTLGADDVLHSLAVQNGAAYAWGQNGSGQLGVGTRTYQGLTPVAVSGMDSGVTAVAAGPFFSLAVKNGGLWAWGSNGSGQLGIGIVPTSPSDPFWRILTPAEVIGLESGVTAISAGQLHALAVKDGAVYAWGYNFSGALGDGTSVTRGTPQLVPGLESGATAVAASNVHSLAVVNGGVYEWGNGGHTPVQVDPTNLSNIVAVAASQQSRRYALSSDGSMWYWNNFSGLPTPQHLLPPVGYKFTSISAGPKHALATLTAVPEPSTFLLAALSLAGLLLPRRAVGSRERRTLIIADHHSSGLAEMSVD